MGEAPGVEGLDDILRDLEGSKRLEDRQASHLRRGPGEIITRGAPEEGRGLTSGLGRQLLAGCGETTLRRYQTLLRFEAMLGPSDDFGYLIGPASQVLEIELDRLLIEPARAVARSLIDALLLDPDGEKQAKALEAWAEGRVPTTIGVGSLVLLALRRGCEHRLEPASAFLESRFVSPYRDLLLSKGLGRGLDTVRVRFRNPACHGEATFDRSEYSEFAGRVVASRGFSTWDAAGPDPQVLGPEWGILHHHLHLSRLRQPGPADGDLALARLLSLPATGSSMEVRVGHRPGPEPWKTRDIRAEATPARRPYRLGDRIGIEFGANRACHVALLDIGTSGAITVLWPNAWRRDSGIEGGRTYAIPGDETPGLDFVLTGRPGPERIVVIATSRALGVPLAPGAGSSFRTLTASDLKLLVDDLARIDDRAVATSEFSVEE